MSGESASRPPSVPRLIGKLRPDDERVRVAGKVENFAEKESLELDDGTGHIKVLLQNETVVPAPTTLANGSIVRVQGLLEPSLDGAQVIRADFIQETGKLDLVLYQKVRAKVEFEVVRT